MKVKVIRPFSTFDATGTISGADGEILDIHYQSTALRLINQGFVIEYVKPAKKRAKADNDQEN